MEFQKVVNKRRADRRQYLQEQNIERMTYVASCTKNPKHLIEYLSRVNNISPEAAALLANRYISKFGMPERK